METAVMPSIMPHGAKATAWGWTFDLGNDQDRSEEYGHKVLSRRALAWIKRGGYSSIHLHAHQANLFSVLGGKLVVREFENESWEVTESILYPGDHKLVQAGRMHQFLALLHTRLLEVYIASPGYDALAEDIQRFSENGCDESLTLKYV